MEGRSAPLCSMWDGNGNPSRHGPSEIEQEQRTLRKQRRKAKSAKIVFNCSARDTIFADLEALCTLTVKRPGTQLLPNSHLILNTRQALLLSVHLLPCF